jgi:hypothetical protein
LNAYPDRSHQPIVGNGYGALRAAGEQREAAWMPLPGIGIIVPASRNSLSIPDLHVLEPGAGDEDSHWTPYSVVRIEVLSGANARSRRAWRRSVHASIPNCQHSLTVAAREVEVGRCDRHRDWKEQVLEAAAERVPLPALGIAMADIYRYTMLAPVKPVRPRGA